MTRPKKLWKTTIIIWSDCPPEGEIEDIAWDASNGDSFCSDQVTEAVVDPAQFPKTDFFDALEDE